MNFKTAALEVLRSADRVTVLTGAGISAESGIPTFRAAQTGLWAQYRPEELATPQAFERNPSLVWEWYAWRRQLVQSAQPNPGHVALARMGTIFKDFSLITQNVDSLHQRAGSWHVIEMHGNISRIKCARENRVIPGGDTLPGSPPVCPQCGDLLRPDVVWFGEALPPDALTQAMRAARSCQVFFSIGTSSVVEPAASLAYLALESGAKIFEINPEHTSLTPFALFYFSGPSGKILPELVNALTT